MSPRKFMNDTSHSVTFSFEHLITLGVIGLTAVGLVMMARSKSLNAYVKPVSWFLAVILVVHEIVWIVGAMILGQWHYSWGLPFQLCDLAILAMTITLIKHYQWVWELAYFWGLGGSLQAVLTPDLGVTFPDYIFIKFFISHGCIVIGVIFLAVGCRCPINFKSVVRVFCITNIYAGFVGIFNWIFGTNYLYLCAKPSQPSILDYVWSGPYYLIGLEAVFMVSLLIYYLPYFFVQKMLGNR